ncbi:ATP-binding protein [Paractinoplanes durhamensis]|uniref:ANTAR domain-containing protein n=1 Tax=Paractinoplanes durhamensis TaxID=113563 RepID=A0ABQ3Z102_9ACTN|nr:ATP-binding protein [Actinoplanes durhamensis]GIE03254.1 hypothetical protein Adu01nite_46040 [Actinoplanes durhamensis]
MSTGEEHALATAFVELSDQLVADYDVVEFLHLLTRRCVELLGVQAAGIMISDRRGALRVMACSSEQAHLLELFEVETDQGPCVQCYATGAPVDAPDLGRADLRWPGFAARAREAGFHAVYAIPVRLRDEVIGVLNLFAVRPGPLSETATHAARAMANITAISLLQHRAVEYRQILAEQLQYAMNSRVAIEQAKGILAENLGLDMGGAFAELRRFAARIGRRLSDVAAAVAAGDFGPALIDPAGPLRVLLVRRFSAETLSRVRAAVGQIVARHGLPEAQTWQFVLAVHEAAANAVRHGGGGGQVLLWMQRGTLSAEISDEGPGILGGRAAVPTTDPGTVVRSGRGLWLINRVCRELDIQTGTSGTRLTMHYPLDSPPADLVDDEFA